MKKSIFATVLVITWCLLAANSFYVSKILQIEQTRSAVLKDQLEDYMFQIQELKARKSYEEGLKDGFANMKNPEYVSGYHAALRDQNQFSQHISVSDGRN